MKYTVLPTIGEDGRPIVDTPNNRSSAQRANDQKFKVLRKKQRDHLIEQNIDKLDAIDRESELLEQQLIDSGLHMTSSFMDDDNYPLNDTFIQEQTQDRVLRGDSFLQ